MLKSPARLVDIHSLHSEGPREFFFHLSMTPHTPVAKRTPDLRYLRFKLDQLPTYDAVPISYTLSGTPDSKFMDLKWW